MKKVKTILGAGLLAAGLMMNGFVMAQGKSAVKLKVKKEQAEMKKPELQRESHTFKQTEPSPVPNRRSRTTAVVRPWQMKDNHAATVEKKGPVARPE